MPTQFKTWMRETQARTDRYLKSFLDAKTVEVEHVSPESRELLAAVSDLTLRGGKRTRPMVLVAAFRAVDPNRDIAETDAASAALEVLQTYLLIHDDWMDRDMERRGGPSVFAAMREAHDVHLGDALTILAGDLASAYASELITAAPFPAGRFQRGLDTFWAIQREVVLGQHLDMVQSKDVDRVYDLKTGSYTVRGPARLGALLAGADDEQLEYLDAYSKPLGIAFQLRDELLGTFGDPKCTGKPAGSDLRSGKRTRTLALAQARLGADEFAPVAKVLGDANADQALVDAAAETLRACGAKAEVEEQLARFAEQSRQQLRNAPFDGEELSDLVDLLADRDH